jgi:hypothetical protein
MLNVKGSLKRHLGWWREHIKNDVIVQTIAEGYKLPIVHIPPPEMLNNNKSANDHASFVDEEIVKLLESGVLLKTNEKPTVVNALTVAVQANGKKRLVLDLRSVNPRLNVAPYKYEDIKHASNYFKKDAFMCTFDLTSGYHHVDVHDAYHQFLGFCWKNCYYVYSVCPFGMSTSGLIFSKILRELVKRWRSMGIAVVMYIDDGFITAQDEQILIKHAKIVKDDLTSAGFIINDKKSFWKPSKNVKWLGFELNSAKNTFIIPEDKIARTRSAAIRNLSHSHACSARELAKTVGKICSFFHALGPVVYILTKDSSKWIAEKENWSNKSAITFKVQNELRFWIRNLGHMITQPLEPISEFSHIIYSDASGTGCGAFIQGEPEANMVHHWTETEKLASSTWREAQAVVLFLEVHASRFKGSNLKWYTDNQGVPSVIKKGSMKEDLNLCAMQILQTCLAHKINVSIDWVPRTLNVEADELSKIIDQDDWQIQPHIFKFMNNKFGPFSIDLFASNLSHQTQKFYSKYWCQGTSGVDAFAFDWGKETCWVVPPPVLIPRVLRHMQSCQAEGVMIIPRWQSSVFWPLLHNGESWSFGISVLLEYKNPKNFFKRGPYGNEVFTENNFQSNVLILKLKFSE